jgi:hypothetical protein
VVSLRMNSSCSADRHRKAGGQNLSLLGYLATGAPPANTGSSEWLKKSPDPGA